jgi:sucrose-6-phosphate hydrolase SacC (GH32 family)
MTLNGYIHCNGRYHLFYRYQPPGTIPHRIFWGHATSEDMVRREDQPLTPEERYTE